MSAHEEADAGARVAAQFELGWALLIGLIVLVLLITIFFTAYHWSSMPPSRVEVIDSTTLHQAGEFIEDNLGTGVDAGGEVVVRVLAEQYSFRPRCILVPEGVPVTFRATSSDVVHGFQVLGTNINSMLVPGYVSTFVMTLQGAGTRSMPCHEFCGVGHASMWGSVQVVPLPQFQSLMRQKRRVNCV